MKELRLILEDLAAQSVGLRPGCASETDAIVMEALASVERGRPADVAIYEAEQAMLGLLVGECADEHGHGQPWSGSVHDPRASVDAAIDQLIAIESHAQRRERHCWLCLQKHARAVRVLLEEAVSLSDGKDPVLRKRAEEAGELVSIAYRVPHGDVWQLAGAARAIRRRLQ